MLISVELQQEQWAWTERFESKDCPEEESTGRRKGQAVRLGATNKGRKICGDLCFQNPQKG